MFEAFFIAGAVAATYSVKHELYDKDQENTLKTKREGKTVAPKPQFMS